MARIAAAGALLMKLMPALAARAALSGLTTPYHSGGCGFWNGVSSIGTLLKLKCSPSKLTVFCVSACMTTAKHSAKIFSVFAVSTP